MPTHDDGHTAEDCELHRFERNRFFHGKLLTARDLEAEQRYHTGRAHTLTRLVTGDGVLCGLDTAVQENETEGRTEAVIQPGAALDCCGRPVVLANRATMALDPRPTDTDGIHLYLTYAECAIEMVPVPGAEQACEEECTYNRILETFGLEYETVEEVEEPDLKSVRPVTFPDSEAVANDTPGSLRAIARSYYENDENDDGGEDEQLVGCPTCEEPRVFLGTFLRGEEDEWTWTAAEDRPLVYHNELLYATIARHATDFENPHEVTLDLSSPIGDTTGARVRIADDPRETPDIELGSDDETVSIAADADLRVIDLSVTGLAALQDLVNDHLADTSNPHEVTLAVRDRPGGASGVRIGLEDEDRNDVDVVLAAATENVSITRSGDRQIDLGVSGTDVPDDLVDRIQRLEDHVERSERELDRHRVHVMERSLWCKCRSFGGLTNRFDVSDDLVDSVVETAKEILEQHDFEAIEWEEYVEGIQKISQFEEQIGEQLQQLDASGVDEYMRAFEELQKALEEDDVLRIAIAQDRLCAAVDCLGGRRG